MTFYVEKKPGPDDVRPRFVFAFQMKPVCPLV